MWIFDFFGDEFEITWNVDIRFIRRSVYKNLEWTYTVLSYGDKVWWRLYTLISTYGGVLKDKTFDSSERN